MHRQSFPPKEPAGLLLWLPALLMAALGLFTACFDPSFGVDEAYTMDFIRGSWGRLLTLCAADVHPPLYFLMLKGWVDFWQSFTPLDATMLAKFFSTLPLVGLMILSATLVRSWWGEQVSLIFSLCFLAGNLTHYASVLRMYSWASFWVTLTALAVCRLLGAGQSRARRFAVRPVFDGLGWALLLFATLGAAYTHYFACVSAGCLWLFLLLGLWRQGRLKEIAGLAGCGVLALLCYLPWAPSLFGQLTAVRNDYWIESVGLKTFLLCAGTPFASEKSPVALASGALLAALFLATLFCFGRFLVRGAQHLEEADGFALLMLGVAPATVLVGALVSWLMRPVFIARYMVPCVPCLWLGFALAARRLQGSRQKALAAALCLVAAVSCGKVLHTEITQGVQYRRFMAFHEQKIGSELLVDEEYHLRETLFFTEPGWNHKALDETTVWDGRSRLWVLSANPGTAARLADENGRSGLVTDWGSFQMCEDHFSLYSIEPRQ